MEQTSSSGGGPCHRPITVWNRLRLLASMTTHRKQTWIAKELHDMPRHIVVSHRVPIDIYIPSIKRLAQRSADVKLVAHI